MDNVNNTILLFNEQRMAFEYLSDEEAGKMIKAIYAYADEGVVPNFEGATMSLFTMVRSQIDRSREVYQKKRDQNRKNSRKRECVQNKSERHPMEIEREPSTSTDNNRYPPTTTDIHPNPTPNPNPTPKPKPDIDDGADTHIINGSDAAVEEDEDYPFDEIWKIYGKFVGNVAELRKRWNGLSADEKRDIFNYVPLYVQSRPETRFRKDFANFLTCRTWETDPITKERLNNGSINHYSNPSNETRRAAALQNTRQLVSQFLAGDGAPVVSFGRGEESVSDH